MKSIFPDIGDTVLWYAGCDLAHGGTPAIVVEKSPEALRLAVLHVGATQVRPTGWIRHIQDPWYNEHPLVRDRDGGWDFTEGYKKQSIDKMLMTQAIQDLDILTEVVDELRDAYSRLPNKGPAKKISKASSH